MSTEAASPTVGALQRYSLNGETMGTRYTALFYAAPGLDEAAINGRLLAVVDTVDRQMSTWKADSDLSRLNAAAVGEWVAVPSELLGVLDCALQISRQSGGAFDIGVGDLVDAWGFGPAGAAPAAAQITALRGRPRVLATAALELDAPQGRVRKLAPVRLDLSGIAKGFGVDELARCLDGLGLTHYLVGIDGEMRGRGAKPGGEPWAVAVEKPLRGVRDVMGVMELSDMAIATSGDYRHFFEAGGQHIAHTMHPASGAPLRNRLAAVTVLAPDCMHADAWATALLVAGESEGPCLARAQGLQALFVVREGETWREILVGGDRPRA